MPLSAGSRLGPYEILVPLGAGGMGEVYRARDSRLKRDVAIKVLPESLGRDPEALARFEREALAVASLSHPNILAIHDFGTERGTSYAVMELLEGDTLRGKLEAGAISQKQAVDYALQIARGLSAAHGRGVVHRDLKPENVFVSKDGHVKILDFGLAKRAEEGPGEGQTSAPTEPGTVMGTMGYMSPEQLRGQPVDHRSDIFSFGALLYELLSGRKAFKRETASDTIAAIMKEEPPELSQSGRNISPALDRVIRHCLEKDRESRFQTAQDVAFALSEASNPTAAVASGGPYAAAPERSGRAMLAIAALAVAALSAAGIMLWKRQGTGSPSVGLKRVAVLPFENIGAAEDDYFADGMADEVRGKLTSIPGIQVIARASSTPYKKSSKTPRQIADELNASYLLTATVRWEKSGGTSRVLVRPELVDVTRPGAAISKWQQPFDAALTDVFQVQSDIASKVASALGVVLGAAEESRLSRKPTESLAAYDSFLKGEEANLGGAATDPPRLRKALSFYEAAVALDPNFAQALARVSVVSSLLYFNSTPVPELAERARQTAEKAVALAPDRPDGYHALGNYQRFIVLDYRRALDEYAKGLAIAPTNASLLGATGLAEKSLGLWDAALEHMRQAERLDPRSASAPARLGYTLLWLRRYREARQALDRGLALAPGNLNLIEQKAMTFLGEGDLSRAREVFEAVPQGLDPGALVAYASQYDDLVWALDERQLDLLLRLTPASFDEDRAVWALGLLKGYARRRDEANVRVHAEEARRALEEQLRAAPDDGYLHANLGVALAYLGRKQEAIQEGEEGARLLPVTRDAVFGAGLQHMLVHIYVLAGDPEKALDHLEPLLKIPYYISPRWLEIDPSFDPLRKNPRFQKLVAAK
jgi:TolB-like protein/Flp pilus assembly protein TadD